MKLELFTTVEEDRRAAEILEQASSALGERRYAVINPGANDAAKRWPAERFGEIAARLVLRRGLGVLVNGSLAEAEWVGRVADAAREAIWAEAGSGADVPVVELPRMGITIGALKTIVRGAAVMVTNDTGPRHFAAAFGVPVVTLFGPTDPRWTTLPPHSARVDVAADPSLPPEEVADDHPERCRIERIEVDEVWCAVESVMRGAGGSGDRGGA